VGTDTAQQPQATTIFDNDVADFYSGRPPTREEYLAWEKGNFDINLHGLMEALTEDINGFTEAWKQYYANLEKEPELRAHLREQLGRIQDALATHAAMLDKLAQ
jgi:hypothetical protein